MMLSRLLKKDAADVEGELDMAAPLKRLEGALVRAGVNFPAGGSLLARRPI
jgi:hypothetical protein